MIEKVKAWYMGRTLREQWLIGVAGSLAMLVAMIYGLAVPIDASEKQLQLATAQRGRLELRAALLKSTPAAKPAVASSVSNLGVTISESAAAAGFELSDGAAIGTDEYAFRLASAKAGALMVWLTGLETQAIELAAIKMQQTDGGYVAADVRVRKRR
jgi:general secretion pathway protein M